MYKKILVSIICFFLFSPLFAQEEGKSWQFMGTIFNNATALPLSGKAGVWHSPVHPGFSAGLIRPWKESEKHFLFQTFRLGYFYHKHSQHAIQLYSEGGYRYTIIAGLGVETRLGAGYAHVFPDMEIFVLNDQGRYEQKTNWGRPQVMGTFALNLGYDFRQKDIPVRVFVDYQFWMQAPFVRNYVPILPNTSLHLGITYKIR